MKVRELLRHKLESVGPEVTVFEVAKKMRDLNIGSLPVAKEGKAMGIVTDRDITTRVTAEEGEPKNLRVDAIMTPTAFCCKGTDTVESCARMMREKQVRRLLVTDGDDNLEGIVSLHDLAVNTESSRLAGELMQLVSSSQRAARVQSLQ